MFLGHSVERTAEVNNLCVNVETVDSVDAERKNILGVSLNAACGSGKHSHVHVLEFANVLYHIIFLQLLRTILSTFAANDTCHFKIGSSLKGLQSVVANIAIAYYGCTYFLHFVSYYVLYL